MSAVMCMAFVESLLRTQMFRYSGLLTIFSVDRLAIM